MDKKNKTTDLDNKYIIDTTELKKGDIIFSTTFNWKSEGIKFFTKSDFSHVMLYVDNNSIIHANGNGVHAYNTQRILFDDKNHCVVYRLKESISDEKVNIIINFVRSLIGSPYSTIEAMLSKIYTGNLKSKKLFCSRLIAQAFSQVNINLVDAPDYCSPENIRQSNYLEIVNIPLRKLTELEKKRILSTEDKPDKQSEITNKLFSEIVKLTSNKNIYGFENLINFLNKENKFNEKISKILRNSGYLTMWVNELIANPVLYDDELYNNLVSNEEKITFNNESFETLKRFDNMQNIYLQQFKLNPSHIYKDLLLLYSILIKKEHLRLKALSKIKIKDEDSDPYLTFLKLLIKLFFVKSSLESIAKEKSHEPQYYELVRKNINDFIINFSIIQNLLKEFNLEKDFLTILNYLKEILNILDNIIYIEMRQKINPENSYIQLQSKTDELIKLINKINYINMFEYS